MQVQCTVRTRLGGNIETTTAHVAKSLKLFLTILCMNYERWPHEKGIHWAADHVYSLDSIFFCDSSHYGTFSVAIFLFLPEQLMVLYQIHYELH